MKKCDECRYRFKCLTVATKKQPKIVSVNRLISGNCDKCKCGKFDKRYHDTWYYTKPVKIGICKKHDYKTIIHKQSTCELFEPKTKLTSKRVNKELDTFINKKVSGLPKYCERKE
jgi:hypothetical protein